MNIKHDNIENNLLEKNIWLDYVQRNRPQAPKDFNEKVRKTIVKRQHRRRLSLVYASIAACIMLMVSVLTLMQKPEEQSYEEKLALLLEAKSMVVKQSHAAPVKKRIIYEDELVIIYSHE